MKFIKQFLIILLLSFLGELLNRLIPLPIPATVWGMCLMFLALTTGLIRLGQVEDTADFFLGIMPMLFIPYGVSLLDNYSLLADHAAAILFITLVSFFVCFAVTGKTADFIISRSKENRNGRNSDLPSAEQEAVHE